MNAEAIEVMERIIREDELLVLKFKKEAKKYEEMMRRKRQQIAVLEGQIAKNRTFLRLPE